MAGSSMTEDACEIKWIDCYKKWKAKRIVHFTETNKLLRQRWVSANSDNMKRLITFQSALTFMAYFWPSIEDHGNLFRNRAGGTSISNLVEVADIRVFSSTNPISGKLMTVMVAINLKQGVQLNSEMMAELKSSLQKLLDLWMDGEKCDAILFTMSQIVHFKYGGLHSKEEMTIRSGVEDFILAAQALCNDNNADTFVFSGV
ncbi:hypothetical protein F4805DRAFT_478829 [Annulohypoxylon moriforme]|nr:hypothetical protein F4805DRAFT_478829 [Annulohypoxylon moriforme]